jgi:hypothetical protein
MQRVYTSWVFAAAVLCAALVVDDWAAASQSTAVYTRIALIVFAASVLTLLGRDSEPDAGSPAAAPVEGSYRKFAPAIIDNHLREIALALDHIRSIRVLLEISQTHRQPIPSAVPRNLELVAKHLDNAQQQLTFEPVDMPSLDIPAPAPARTLVRLPKYLSARR